MYRDGDLAVYEHTPEGSPESPPRYDAIRIQKHEEYTIAGVTIPATEAYPPDAKWGVDGFTYWTKTQAMQIGLAKLAQQTKIKEQVIVPIKFPAKFTVKDLATFNNIPLSQAYTEVKTNSRIVECDKIKTGARGKPSIVYTCK